MTMRRIFIFFGALAIGMMASAQTSGIWTNYKAESFSKKSDDNKTITIASAEELALLAYSIYTNGMYRDYTITLSADLDLGGHYWIPIGDARTNHDFIGTFDGDIYTISNLDVWVKQKKDNDQDPGDDVTSNGNVAGLFGKIGAGGTVKDVIISSGTNIHVKNPKADCSVGGIAGINNGTIIGCSNAVKVTGNFSTSNVGGIVGENHGTIQNCYNLGNVYTTKTNNHIGGIVGNNAGNVQNCFTRCEITAGGGTTYETVTPYPLAGNNDGTVSGCFYMNGTENDVPSYNNRVIPLADASSNITTISKNLGSGKNILFQDRTLYSDGDWNTICLPFDIPSGAEGYSPIAGATVMTLLSTSFSAGTLTLNFTNAPNIEAGKPYIVKWNRPIAGDLSDPVFQNVTLSNSTSDIETSYANFVGSFSPVSIAGDGGDNTKLYLGAANTVYYPTSSMTINSCRAYFQLNGNLTVGDASSGNGINVFALNLDGEETGINSTFISSESVGDGHWYDLSGRKVADASLTTLRSSLPKGIYIHNGKKIVVK